MYIWGHSSLNALGYTFGVTHPLNAFVKDLKMETIDNFYVEKVNFLCFDMLNT
jgi:hypothetical protein